MKKKRKMPNHIVLPNGMWRFIKSGKSSVRTMTAIASTPVSKKVRKRFMRRVSGMARKRKHFGKSRGLGVKGMLFTPKGLIAGALIGAGIATLAEKLVPQQVIPFQGEVLGLAVAGPAGAIGSLARTLLKPNTMSAYM